MTTRPTHACSRHARAGQAAAARARRDEGARGSRSRWSPPTTRRGPARRRRRASTLILVGDSAAMTVLGHDSTVPVTMDEMLFLTRAVDRGARRPLVVARHAVRLVPGLRRGGASANAIRFVKEARRRRRQARGRRADALARARRSSAPGIPVMGHIGLTPQSATMLGGFKAQGRTAEKALRLVEDALALEAAGCFAIVLEAVPAPGRGADHRGALAIPTIGIGAGRGCDGQVLVWHDLLGLYEGHAPRFVKQYADLADEIQRALERVRRRRPRAPLPGGAAHLLDARGRARAVRGGARRPREVRERR